MHHPPATVQAAPWPNHLRDSPDRLGSDTPMALIDGFMSYCIVIVCKVIVCKLCWRLLHLLLAHFEERGGRRDTNRRRRNVRAGPHWLKGLTIFVSVRAKNYRAKLTVPCHALQRIFLFLSHLLTYQYQERTSEVNTGLAHTNTRAVTVESIGQGHTYQTGQRDASEMMNA
jgi:hypothetical protein